MSEEKKLALLIDSDNVSAKYAQFILQEASKYGELSYKRVYGDWEKGGNGWHFPAINNSILPVQQTCYIAGKNATDFSMIIDAMDILYAGNVDGFVLVTSDSDFTRLAIRLREAGKLVVGIGEVKTPLAFTSSCHHFSYLNQICDAVGEYDEKTLRRAVLDYVKENDDKRLDLAKIDSFLTSRYGNIDFSLLGFKRLSNFIDSFSELRRNNTFVSLKKKTPPQRPSVHLADAPSEKEIASAIAEYLKINGVERDNMMKIESSLNGAFGKIDYSRFGSKRFAKFIDRLPEFVREGTTITFSAASAPVPGELNAQSFSDEVQKYAAENMPNGGNLGQLNNMLLEKYGKNYVSDLGFSDFAAAVSSVSEVKAAKNRVFVLEAEKPAGQPPEESAPESEPTENVLPAEEQHAPEKPEINSVKRDILSCAAQSAEGIPLPALGKILSEKYGKNYLKELGFGTMKNLVTEIAGVRVKDNRLTIDENFLKRTDAIEQFVYDFARGEGSHSIKALSAQIKKNFEGFDFTDYGYVRFTDFINAIDGVRADRYHIVAED